MPGASDRAPSELTDRAHAELPVYRPGQATGGHLRRRITVTPLARCLWRCCARIGHGPPGLQMQRVDAPRELRENQIAILPALLISV